jgi:HSP20 family protein
MVRSLMNRTNRAPLAPLSRVFENFFDDPFFSSPALTLMPVERNAQQGFALDLSEDDQALIVRATLPGFTKDEVNVEIDDGVLTISGEHNEEKTEGGENERYYRRETRFGSVQRRIALPVPVREESAQADLKDGVLTLRIPKIQKAPAKRITIGQPAAQTPPNNEGAQPRPDRAAQPKSGNCRC